MHTLTAIVDQKYSVVCVHFVCSYVARPSSFEEICPKSFSFCPFLSFSLILSSLLESAEQSVSMKLNDSSFCFM